MKMRGKFHHPENMHSNHLWHNHPMLLLKMVQEIFLQEMLTSGMITLEEYTDALGDDSSSPKAELSMICAGRRERKNKIAEIQKQVNAYASAMRQTIIEQGGDPDEMFTMQNSGDASVGSEEQPDTLQM